MEFSEVPRQSVAMATTFSCERSAGCSSSRIIFKFGMKVRYDKGKTPINFGVVVGRFRGIHVLGPVPRVL